MPDSIWVLDTSVVAAWFFTDEPQRDRALAVREHVRDHPGRYVVPALFHAEFIHVLARKSGRNQVFVESSLALVLRFGLRTLALSERALLRTAHWACLGLSGYDATFVALSEDLDGRWLTADKVATKVAGSRAQNLDAWPGDETP